MVPLRGRRVGASFFDRPVLDVAPELLGCTVTHAGVTVRLTEVEAYDGAQDPGSHAYRGRTPRVESMFGPPGTVYVYFTYGMHFCCNLVCGEAGRASAVLLRAGEVVAGLELARERRQRGSDRDLARGPARLATCLALARGQDGATVLGADAEILVRRQSRASDGVRSGPRTGVSGTGGDGNLYPWRFWLDGEPTVSVYRPAVPRRRRRS